MAWYSEGRNQSLGFEQAQTAITGIRNEAVWIDEAPHGRRMMDPLFSDSSIQVS